MNCVFVPLGFLQLYSGSTMRTVAYTQYTSTLQEWGCVVYCPWLGVMSALPATTLAQIQELKTLGFTPLDHTWAHTDLTTVTYAQARTAMSTNKAWMLANGLGWLPILVYPHGKYNDTVIQAAIDEGYLYARTAGKNQIRYLPTWGVENPYRLGSIDLGGKTWRLSKLAYLNFK